MTSANCTNCSNDNHACPAYRRSRIGTKMAFMKNGTCSRTLMTVLDDAFGHPMPLEEKATDPLAGGLMQGYQCGMVWGASLAAGAEAHRRFGSGPTAAAATIRAAQNLLTAFEAQNDHINCIEITETDPRNKWQVFLYFLVKGGTFVCMRRAADFAPTALAQIHRALSAPTVPLACDGINCATQLAEQMGAAPIHATMAAGLAGGIGLSGGGCGALGAAIWLTGINGAAAEAPRDAVNKKIEAIIAAFLEVTDYEFECADIVGRRFDTPDDHADHLQGGGCEAIVETLARTAGAMPADIATRHLA